MSRDPQKKLDKIARRERWSFLAIVLAIPSVVILFGFAWLQFMRGPVDPLSRTYFLADMISKTDISLNEAVSIEVVLQFNGLQRVFQSSDPAVIAQIDTVACVMQTKGAPIGEDVPRPRYYALMDPSKCTASE